MIIGDPFKFAVQFDVVGEWSDETFKNGIFRYLVSGAAFPRGNVNATLGTEMNCLINFSCLEKVTTNNRLFGLLTNQVYEELSDLTFPNDLNQDNDYTHLVSTQSLLDGGYQFFLLNGESHARLIFGIDRGCQVFEVSLEKGFFEDVVSRTIKEMRRFLSHPTVQ